MQINIHINESNPSVQQTETLTSAATNVVTPVAGGTAPDLGTNNAQEVESTTTIAQGVDAGVAQIAHILEEMPDVMVRNGAQFENAGTAPQID
ncbi:MAG: hypothetical protein NW218_10185 [Saprospiraceae bacterium]|nr:hypothetical protein [Saprospiraceae bacterium]